MPLDWLSSPDRELFCKATDTLRQWGAKLQGFSVQHSVIHGDFHADNLIFHNAKMTGIDMERASWAPIAYDAATMFVFLQKISAPDLSDETRLVLQQEFLGQGPLAPSEHSTILPFLMAVRLLHIFHRTHPREHGNPRFESMRLGIRALITSQGLLH